MIPLQIQLMNAYLYQNVKTKTGNWKRLPDKMV